MRTLITEQQIRQRIEELGRQLSADYSGRPLTVVAVLTGSLVLLADLIRCISTPLKVTLVSASSYGGTRTTAGHLTINDNAIIYAQSGIGGDVPAGEDGGRGLLRLYRDAGRGAVFHAGRYFRQRDRGGGVDGEYSGVDPVAGVDAAGVVFRVDGQVQPRGVFVLDAAEVFDFVLRDAGRGDAAAALCQRGPGGADAAAGGDRED